MKRGEIIVKHRIVIIEMSFHLNYAHSLKDKRQLKRRLVDSLKNLNVSVAETQDQEIHQKLHLTLSYVAISESEAQKKLYSLREHVEKRLFDDVTMLSFNEEIL